MNRLKFDDDLQGKYCMKNLVILVLVLIMSQTVSAQEANTKFYNFDDLLINGAYQKPAVLLTDSRKKLKFEKLLNLKKEFLDRIKDTAKDKSLR